LDVVDRFWDSSSTGWGRSSCAVLIRKRGEAIGGYCGRGQVARLATRSVDSCVGLPRLYETVVQEGQGGGWEGDILGAEQGDCQLEVRRRAPGWDLLCSGSGTLEETHTAVRQHSH
jgi:hypothetical protein